MTVDLARRLLASGAVSSRDVEAALYLSVVRGVSLARALVDRGVLSERALEDELSRKAGMPLRQVTVDPDLVTRLPRGICRILAAVPLRLDAAGVAEVAAVDSLDTHVVQELSFHLGVPVRPLRATMAAIEEAIRRLELADGAASTRARRRTPAFPHGAPDTVPPSPPPPSGGEDIPIPLVKRLSVPNVPQDAVTSDISAGELEVLREMAAAESLEPPTLPPAQRRSAARQPILGAPAVSFPSSPPPGLPPEEETPVETLPPSRRVFAASLGEIGEGHLDEEETSLRTLRRQREADERTASLLVGEEEATPLTTDTPEVDGPEPQTIPHAPDAGWTPSLPELLMLIRRAPSRDELLDLVLRALTVLATRAAIFVAKKDQFRGWSCNPAFGSEEELREVYIPTELPSVLATAAAAGYYLGPIPRTPGHMSLYAVLRTATSDVAVYVVRVKNRAALLLVADELDDSLVGTRSMGDIAQAASEALTRILSGR